MKITALRIFLSLCLVLLGANVHAIEEPSYLVNKQFDTFEVRTYDPYVVAEVVVPGPEQEAGNQGFRLLAAYIFGGNVSQQKMAMTAPVTQVATSEKIAMTAPVIQTPAREGFVVQFKMPRAYTLDTLPKPLDDRVKLREVPAASYAVIRFSGLWTEGNSQKHLLQLQQGMTGQGLKAAGEPVYARYNAPFVPWFLRRNEIWMPVTLN
jgi:hypothetical protein